MLSLIFFQNSLIVEVWDDDDVCKDIDDKIDNFTFPLPNPLEVLNLSNSITVEGHHKIGNLTLSYGNITADRSPCDSMEYAMFSTFTHAYYDNPTTAPCQCNAVECPMLSTSTQTHQGEYYKNENWLVH